MAHSKPNASPGRRQEPATAGPRPATPLIQLENVAVNLGGRRVLEQVTWALRPGEHWSVTGHNGSGKSTLLKLIRGDLWPAPGTGGHRSYRFDGEEQTSAVGVRERIALVSPEQQTRYLRLEWRQTVRQVIRSGVLGGDYVYQPLTRRQGVLVQAAIERFGVRHLLARDVQQLSTGELRKVLVARALAGAPQVLICDEICDGLDQVSRHHLLAALEQVMRTGTQLIYCTHRAEEDLPSLTHELTLAGGRIIDCRTRHKGARPAASRARAPRRAAARPRMVFDPRAAQPAAEGEVLIGIENATVILGARRALRDIRLELRAGQHWAFLGPNGAGKSTLLKLIHGDVQPAWGARVRRFALSPQHTIWEAKQRMGYLSPELQSNHHATVTGAEAVASGFSSSVGLARQPSRRAQQQVKTLLSSLQLENLADRCIQEMSYGELRKILLARALVHQPKLLLCDEPFDGLDAASKAELSALLDEVASRGTSLVVVTHHIEDLPACLTHVAHLKAGRIIAREQAAGPARWSRSKPHRKSPNVIAAISHADLQ